MLDLQITVVSYKISLSHLLIYALLGGPLVLYAYMSDYDLGTCHCHCQHLLVYISIIDTLVICPQLSFDNQQCY